MNKETKHQEPQAQINDYLGIRFRICNLTGQKRRKISKFYDVLARM